jgi:tryptophan-rich sensory protein
MTTTSWDVRAEPQHRPKAHYEYLAVSLLAVAAVSLLGRLWTDTGTGSWYDQLDKPPWTPPGALFGIAWTVLYVSMAVAAWRIARLGLERADVRAALAVYSVQLVLNLGWTAVFFGAESPGWAIIEIGALMVAIAATIALFARVDRVAAWLLVPYLAWVAFATTLTVGIFVLN